MFMRDDPLTFNLPMTVDKRPVVVGQDCFRSR
jgi:hypothetical protein